MSGRKRTATGSQTVGPYFEIGLSRMLIPNVAPESMEGLRFTISGHVFDADGKPIPDALLETWQANTFGKYAHPADLQDKPLEQGFTGFGRVSTDDNGSFSVTTVKPGRVPGPDGALQAPHIDVLVSMRGLLRHLLTRIYFPGESANDDDAILRSVDPARRDTLIARTAAGEATALQWDVHCGGENETVFFEF